MLIINSIFRNMHISNATYILTNCKIFPTNLQTMHVPVSVRKSTIDYLIETTCICFCALLCFDLVKFYVFIIMSLSVKRHEF